MKAYLDSSAIVKRYILEPGSSAVDHVFDECWIGELSIATSIWNIGEVLGVFDARRGKGWLGDDEFRRVFRNFIGEIIRLLRLRVLELIPIPASILVETWPLILIGHIYEADALQIQTCIYSGSDVFFSADKKLIDVALRVGIKAVNIEDENKVKDLLKNNDFSDRLKH
ncbi:type II toxin-antitoxin system VapC family toxin [Candidatus Bathyarchaeota archaeon]|nr:type II toxin-antitoxin system VapC family toxin [Candidatus Bathyarchaeota archaeon]